MLKPLPSVAEETGLKSDWHSAELLWQVAGWRTVHVKQSPDVSRRVLIAVGDRIRVQATGRNRTVRSIAKRAPSSRKASRPISTVRPQEFQAVPQLSVKVEAQIARILRDVRTLSESSQKTRVPLAVEQFLEKSRKLVRDLGVEFHGYLKWTSEEDLKDVLNIISFTSTASASDRRRIRIHLTSELEKYLETVMNASDHEAPDNLRVSIIRTRNQ